MAMHQPRLFLLTPFAGGPKARAPAIRPALGAAAVSEPTVMDETRPAAATVRPARIVVETSDHSAAFDRLVDRVFGPGRFAKVSQRLREDNDPFADLSFMALDGTRLVGGVRLWPVRVGGQPAVFLGPVAVDPDCRSHGVGGDLIVHACEAARSAGHGVVVLVGDRSFFEPLGFQVVPRHRLSLPGPVDPGRTLWRELVPGVCEALQGPVTVR